MSEYLVNLKQGIDFAPSSEIAEILQNVRTILTTRLGSVPLERDFVCPGSTSISRSMWLELL